MTVRVDVDGDDGGDGQSAAGAGGDAGQDAAGATGDGATGDQAGGAGDGAAGESVFERWLVRFFVEREVSRAARYQGTPVLADGIIDGLTGLEIETLDYREAVALLGEASRLASAAGVSDGLCRGSGPLLIGEHYDHD